MDYSLWFFSKNKLLIQLLITWVWKLEWL